VCEQTEAQKTVAANELKHLSESELLDVLECARKVSARDHAMLLVGYTHGLRNQEIARLRTTVWPQCMPFLARTFIVFCNRR
jgi:site-specific recombinase XerD